MHKELTRLRFKDIDKDKDKQLLIYKTVRVISGIKTEDEKLMIRNRLDRISHLLVPKPAVNKELEDFKLKHDEEINELKSKHMEDEARYEKEKEDLLNQRIEIEQELQKLKDQYEEECKKPKLISYEVNLNLKLRTNLFLIKLSCFNLFKIENNNFLLLSNNIVILMNKLNLNSFLQ